MIPIHDDNPTRTIPFVTISLIIGCTLASLWELTSLLPQQKLVYGQGATNIESKHGCLHQ